MSRVIELTDRHIDRAAALDPVAATFEGIGGHEDQLTDYSPSAQAERSALRRTTLAELDAAPMDTRRDQLVVDLARERFDAEQAVDDAEHLRRLSILGSPLQAVRTVFELMPRATADDWATLLQRLRQVPQSVASIHAALDAGRAAGLVAARRQALACAQQATIYGGAAGTDPSFGNGLLGAFDAAGIPPDTLRADLQKAAEAADSTFVAFGDYLRTRYAPRAAETDAVGEERYRRFARYFTGADLDLDQLYAWGWEQVRDLQRQIDQTAARILPGAKIGDVVAALDRDAQRAVHGPDAFRLWAQALQDEAIAALDGTHFEIPEAIRCIEVRIAPAGSAAAPYYTRPSSDLSRPGRVWYPTLGRQTFPTWSEVSTAYHEGVPGHHLQIATLMQRSDILCRFQQLTLVSGHAEGWALYAERLMDELGFLADPTDRLGYLGAQMLRALRIVIDVGLHTDRTISDAEPHLAGQRWTPSIAEALLSERSLQRPDFLASEVIRYLGLPGQAISYKVGERVWLEARDTARTRLGAAFDLAAFHSRALQLGPLGLGHLATALTEPATDEAQGGHMLDR